MPRYSFSAEATATVIFAFTPLFSSAVIMQEPALCAVIPPFSSAEAISGAELVQATVASAPAGAIAAAGVYVCPGMSVTESFTKDISFA